MSLKNLSVVTKIPKLFKDKLKNKKINQIYSKFEKSLDIKENFVVAVATERSLRSSCEAQDYSGHGTGT